MIENEVTMEKQGFEKEDLDICTKGMRDFIKQFLCDSGLGEKGFLSQSIPGDGSKRVFWRIVLPMAQVNLIAMENKPVDDFSNRENFSYLRIGNHLFKKGIPVPQIYRSDLIHGWFIMEDMGSTSLQAAYLQEKDPVLLYERVVELLLRLQLEGARGFETAWTCQTEKYDRFVMRRKESDYFRDAFLSQYLGLGKDWRELEHPFDYLAETSAKAENRFLLHRDFQSRNIMICGSKIGILDWQGARLGPLAYDLASLLIDPYTSLSPHQRDGIYHAYVHLLKQAHPGWVESFQRYFPYLAIQRNLQILGAFSFLSKARGKTYFEVYIPPALRSLVNLLEELGDSNLTTLLDVVKPLPSFK